MAINASKVKTASNRIEQPNLEPGPYPARLVQIIDLGLQPQRPYKGVEKPPAHELMVTYELSDAFMIDKDGNDIIFGECKYWTNKVGLDVLNQLEHNAEQVEWKKAERKNHFILFSINGFTDELTELARVRKDLILMS